MRRSFFTLLEMMISLIFLTLLLSTLFIWYRHLVLQRGTINEREWQVCEERYADQQLMKIIPRANLKACFFATMSDQNSALGPSLVFTFDYGAQVEAPFAGTVLGRLFLDAKTKTLCLGIWPKSGETDLCHTRKLLENVTQVEFSFYFPPDPFKLTVDPAAVGKPSPTVGWQREWKKEYQELPSMMIMKLVHEGREVELAYDLPLSRSSRILYCEGS